jgi:P27 family predicted phage terminase small subunit
MGKRGPAKTPTAILELSGSWRAGERKNEPVPPDREYACPEWIRERAKEYWDNITGILSDMGVMSCADVDALSMYCQSLAKLEEAEKFIEENGTTYTTLSPDGSVSAIRPYPQVQIAKDMTATVSRLGQQFGLTPSSRAHLEVKDSSKPTDKNSFFRHTKTG